MEDCMRTVFKWIAAAALALAAPLAIASFHTFQIDQIYSNADGTVQFVVLHEAFGSPSEQFLQGHQLTVTKAGITKTITFDHNLAMVSTAGRYVLIATPGFAA